MPDFIDAENRIKELFPKGSFFYFKDKKYQVTLCGKPRPTKGECKTDVYIKGIDDKGEVIELKISVKKENADFLENKISLTRAKEIFGEDASDIIKKCTLSIQKELSADYLVYFDGFGRTQKHSIKLGWKFELVNKLSGDKSDIIELTDKQKHDVFAGINLPENKRNSTVEGQIINNSGVANYILNIENDNDNLTQKSCLEKLQPIKEFAESQTVYFACKALNYRYDEKKCDGPRPLAVYVDWFIDNGKLNARLVYDKPLEHNGKEEEKNLLESLKSLRIKGFDDLKKVLSPDIKYYSKP